MKLVLALASLRQWCPEMLWIHTVLRCNSGGSMAENLARFGGCASCGHGGFVSTQTSPLERFRLRRRSAVGPLRRGRSRRRTGLAAERLEGRGMLAAIPGDAFSQGESYASVMPSWA